MRSRDHLSHLLCSTPSPQTLAQLHSLLLRTGLLTSPDCFFATHLTASYAALLSPSHALTLFDEIPHPTTFLYNAALRTLSRFHQWPQALHLFRRMTHLPNSCPDPFPLPIALRACTALSALANGRTVHALSIKSPNASSDMFVGAALIGLYSKCGDINDARCVLDGFVEPDVVLWTSVVSAYKQNGYPVEAVLMFHRMVVGRLAVPELVTVVSLVTAIGEMRGLREGKCCHGFMVRMGFDSDLSLGNSILNLYAKMGAVEYGLKLFEGMGYRDVITWSCMVACYARNGMPENALAVYKRMVDVGVEPNSVTVISTLQACSESLDLEQGQRLHDFVVGKGFEMELAVSTALIDMYMKCSRYGEAMDIFHRMPQIDVVSWAVVISGYAGNGFPSESL